MSKIEEFTIVKATLVLIICFAWMFSDWSSDPYTLGLLRGFVWPTILFVAIETRLNQKP